MASNIITSGLQPVLDGTRVRLIWVVADDNSGTSVRLNAVEVWRSTVNDFSTATKIGEARNRLLDLNLLPGQLYYYWLRARDNGGQFAAIYPGATTGVPVQIPPYQSNFALVNAQVVCTQGAGQITFAIKLLGGDDPSVDNPAVCQFQTAGGLFYYGTLTTAKSKTFDSSNEISSGSGFPLMAAGVPFQLWMSAHDNGNGTFEIAFSHCATQQLVRDFFQGVSALFGDPGTWAAASGASLTANARTIARLVWANGLTTNPHFTPSWTVPTSIILTGTGSPMPGDAVQTPLPLTANVGASGSTILDGNSGHTPTWSEGDSFQSAYGFWASPSPVNYIENDIITSFSYSVAANLTLALFMPQSGNALRTTGVNVAANTLVQMRLYDFRQVANLFSLPFPTPALRVGGDVAGTWRNGANASIPSGWGNGTMFGIVWRQREIMY